MRVMIKSTVIPAMALVTDPACRKAFGAIRPALLDPLFISNFMFNPSRDQVRQFFTDTWTKHRQNKILTPIESMALTWILQHPEYHDALENPNATQEEFAVEKEQVNPFLHLSMHLA